MSEQFLAIFEYPSRFHAKKILRVLQHKYHNCLKLKDISILLLFYTLLMGSLASELYPIDTTLYLIGYKNFNFSLGNQGGGVM